MYAFSPEVLDEITGALPQDIGFDLLPRLVGRAAAVALDDARFLMDVGDPIALERARAEWEGKARQ
jgi:mannose-1-phosphate guanylyltransferase